MIIFLLNDQKNQPFPIKGVIGNASPPRQNKKEKKIPHQKKKKKKKKKSHLHGNSDCNSEIDKCKSKTAASIS